MDRRRRTTWAWIAAAAVAAVAVGASVGRAGAYGSGPYSFPHQPHLSKATVDAALAEAAALDRTGRRPGGGGTADRECRVCHDYSKGPESHLEGCMTCHVGGKHLEVALAAAPAGRTPFPHAAHLKDPAVTCFSCHRVEREMGWIEFSIPEQGLGRRGANGRPGGARGDFTCADCHAAHEPAGGRVAQDDRTGDGKECATCHLGAREILPRSMRPGGPGALAPVTDRPFRHADHGGAAGACDACHAPIRASRTIWDYDPVRGTATACAACHVDASGVSLVGLSMAPRTTQVPFVLFGNFPHDRHLAPPEGRVATSGGVRDGCRTCHFPETASEGRRPFADRAPSQEPVGRDALVDYDACTPCHEAWAAPGHGVGAWACFKCHSGAADASGALAMAKARVARGAIESVAFSAHAHPGITQQGAALAHPAEADGKACADCHVAPVATIPSRTAGKSFPHAAHVPADPRAADCLVCHPTAATASWSADLERVENTTGPPTHASGVAGAARGCFECHVGTGTVGVTTSQTPDRTVPEFDHKGHVTGASWKGGRGIPCSECHTQDRAGSGTAGIATAADAADCTRCHSHDPASAEKFARTGAKTSDPASSASCRHCHDDVGERATPSKVPPRVHLSLRPGRQHHDLGGACASCHARTGTGPAAYSERIRKADVRVSIHEDPSLAKEWFNDPSLSRPDAQGRSCMSCHRSEPRGYLRALGGR